MHTYSFPFGMAVQAGLVWGVSFRNVIGRNTSTATNDAIWSTSTAYTEPASAEACNVVSASANDAAAGTGARTLYIEGINELYDVVSETLTMNGTTNVQTQNKYWNIHRAYVVTSGSGGTQAGNITITSTASGSPVVGTMLTGYNRTQSTVFMVPRGHTAFIDIPNLTVQNATANKTLDIGMFKKPFGGVFRVQLDWLFISDTGSQYQEKLFGAPFRFEEKSTVLFKCIAASDPFDVTVDYDIWLINNNILGPWFTLG